MFRIFIQFTTQSRAAYRPEQVIKLSALSPSYENEPLSVEVLICIWIKNISTVDDAGGYL